MFKGFISYLLDKSPTLAILFIASMIVLIYVSAYMFVEAVSEFKCHGYGSQTGRETKYTYLNGCYVKINNQWELKEHIRKVED